MGPSSLVPEIYYFFFSHIGHVKSISSEEEIINVSFARKETIV